MPSDRWLKIESIYHEAVSRAQADRAAYLDEACAGDRRLRDEVESLLEQDDAASFLETPIADIRAGATGIDAEFRRGPAGTTSAGGRRIGSYLLVERVAGSPGELYRARDTRRRRDVLVRLLPPSFADPERVRRFESEARRLLALRHPAIAGVRGLKILADRTLVVISDPVGGQTLAACLDVGPFDDARAMAVAREVAGALRAAASAGIAHGHLAPDHVYVHDGGGVTVAGFGLGAGESSAAEAEAADVVAFGRLVLAMCVPRGLRWPDALPGSDRALPDAVPAGMQAVVAGTVWAEPAHRLRTFNAVVAALEGR